MDIAHLKISEECRKSS